MEVTNTPAYFDMTTITAAKSLTQAPGYLFTKVLTKVSKIII